MPLNSMNIHYFYCRSSTNKISTMTITITITITIKIAMALHHAEKYN